MAAGEPGVVVHTCHANTQETGKNQEVKVTLDYTEFQACLGYVRPCQDVSVSKSLRLSLSWDLHSRQRGLTPQNQSLTYTQFPWHTRPTPKITKNKITKGRDREAGGPWREDSKSGDGYLEYGETHGMQ